MEGSDGPTVGIPEKAHFFLRVDCIKVVNRLWPPSCSKHCKEHDSHCVDEDLQMKCLVSCALMQIYS